MEKHEISKCQEQAGLLKAIENTDICMFWYYPKEKLITVNERTARIYQCKRIYQNMPESFADDFVHPSTQADFYEMYHRIDAGEPVAQASFSSIDRQNWCTVTLTTLTYDEQGRPETAYGIVQNISEMKMQEAEYHSNRRMLGNIISALSKIYMFNYYVDLLTGEFTEILGLDYVTDLVGKEGNAAHAFALFAETLIDPNHKTDFQNFVDLDTLAVRIGTNQNISLEYCSLKKGWCRASFIVVNRSEAGEAIQVEFVVENISAERKKELEAKEELERAYEAANRANASKSAFLNNMSHDIRTPMNAIVGFSAIAASHIDDRERVQDCIAKITASSKHLLSIINEVLDMSRIESGKVHIQEQETSFPVVMQDFLDMIQGQVKAKGLELYIDTMNLEHEHVYADEARLHRVLLNLVGNAVKFTPAGGMISICLAEKPQTVSGYGNYVITVKDTGIGMSEDFLPHVFEAFERERTSTVSKVEGTGLGMAITKNIVELMGGTIRAESQLGKGTVFTIELSLKLMEQEPEDMRIEKLAGLHSMVADEQLSGKHILLAEDNELNQEIAVEILTEAGFTVDTAENGQIAVDKVASAGEGAYDVVLMDIQMPVMDGYQAARAIRAMPDSWSKELPILAMTANAFEEDRQKAFEAGMNGHLAKPIEVGKLFQMLDQILR